MASSGSSITNDDAVVDCIVYASAVREGLSPPGIRLSRIISDANPEGAAKGCSITMCGNDDDPECKLLRYCQNGHYMHDKCIEYMFTAAEDVQTVVCPQCRSNLIMDLTIRAKPIPPIVFEAVFSDRAVAAKSIKHFAPEVNRVSTLPMTIFSYDKKKREEEESKRSENAFAFLLKRQLF